MNKRRRKQSIVSGWPMVVVGLLCVPILRQICLNLGVYVESLIVFSAYVACISWFFGKFAGYITAFAVSAVVTTDVAIHIDTTAPVAAVIWVVLARALFIIGIAYVIAQLRAALNRERTYARVDQLTGVNNRFSFEEKADKAVRRAKRKRQALTVAFIDCDNFKDINDRYGHEAGDELLHCIGQTLQTSVRPTDIVARIGGDEFAVIFSDYVGTCPHSAIRRLRHVLRDTLKEHGFDVTLSIGVATFNSVRGSYKDLLRVADRLQYNAKATGKNAIIYGIVEDTRESESPVRQNGAA